MRSLLLFVMLLPGLACAEPLQIFTSVLPIKTLVEKVGGTHVQVQAMVKPGYSPHTYDPTPKQIAALANAQLFVRTGVPFEAAWMSRIRSANPRMQILDVRGEEPLHEAGHDHDAHESDPHIWTDPLQAKAMLRFILDELIALAPQHREDFTRNYNRTGVQLEQLDSDIRALLAPLQNRQFLVFHPAWGHFAQAYGLTQVAIEHDGKEPSAKLLVSLIERARRENIRVVFVQPQFDQRQAQQVGRAIGGEVIAVDPLAADYVNNLRFVATKFAEALRK